jgi:hypothetical protein
MHSALRPVTLGIVFLCLITDAIRHCTRLATLETAERKEIESKKWPACFSN